MEGSKHADAGRDARLSASRPPGVYYELFFEKKVQPAFQTGVPVFVGFAKLRNQERQHATRIHHLDRWPQFQRFETASQNYLSYAVRGFFENGGEHCVVIPVESMQKGDAAEVLTNIFRPGGVLDDLEDIDLVCIPDAMAPDIRSNYQAVQDIQAGALEHCRRMGDRFAILDGFRGREDDNRKPSAQKGALTGSAISHWQALPPECGALYYPWVSV
ncbi:MAG TPA: hypothetical protein VFI43_10430, partial [Nitrosospira sp.]|nr:hypothetical protein [Nitrosospira sp.]